jgi:O-antigen/teichoic acid export membrane protein
MKLTGLYHRIIQSSDLSKLKNITLFSVSSGLSQIFLMVYAIAVARHLGPDVFGLYAGNYAYAGLLIFLVNWGMDTWMLREAGARSQSKLYSSTVMQAKLMMGILWLVLLTGLMPIVRPSLFPRSLIFIVALDLLMDTIMMTLVSGLNISQRTAAASGIVLFARGGRLAGALVLILFGIKVPQVFALFRLVATLSGAVSGIVLLRPKIALKNAFAAFHTVRLSFTYALPEMLALIYAQVDVSLMGLLSTRTSLGVYSPAVSLINALLVIPNSIFYIVVPTLSRIFEHERIKLAKEFWKMVLVYAVVGIALGAVTALIAPPVLTKLLGKEYLITGQLVMVMSPIILLKSFSFASVTYLVVVGWQAKRTFVQVISAVLNISLNLIFIPRYGPFGAAIIYVLSELVITIGYSTLALLHSRAAQSSLKVTRSYPLLRK